MRKLLASKAEPQGLMVTFWEAKVSRRRAMAQNLRERQTPLQVRKRASALCSRCSEGPWMYLFWWDHRLTRTQKRARVPALPFEQFESTLQSIQQIRAWSPTPELFWAFLTHKRSCRVAFLNPASAIFWRAFYSSPIAACQTMPWRWWTWWSSQWRRSSVTWAATRTRKSPRVIWYDNS
jgi:hypothetical protein